MITLPDFIAIALAAFALYQLQDLRKQHNARLTTLERRDPLPATKAPAHDWQKPIEGFEPEIPAKVLPRSKEEKQARVKTEWEINSDFKIIG